MMQGNCFRKVWSSVLFFLIVGCNCAKAEDITYKLTIQPSDFTTTNYADNNKSHEVEAVGVSDSEKKKSVKWTSYQVYQNSGVMQWQKNKGYIYNETSLGTITEVTVNTSAGTFTTYYGTSEHPTSDTSVGNGFFTVAVGGATGKTTSVEVTFTCDDKQVEVPTPVITPATGSFADAQSVTITAGEDVAHIYYTTDGNDPTTSSPEWTSESTLTISATTTVKAIAVDAAGNQSPVASSTITILPTYTSYGQISQVMTTQSQLANIQFDGWNVQAATSNNAYLVDQDGNVALVYCNGHGFKQGNKLTGTFICGFQNYNGILEFTEVKASDLTVEDGFVSTPIQSDIASLTDADYGKLVTLKDVKISTATYEANTTKLTQGDDDIVFYNTFGALTGMNFSTKAYYDVTGIVINYVKNGVSTLEVAPRSSEDVVCNLIAPEISFARAVVQVEYDANSISANSLNTNSDGDVSYTSSNPSVATISANGDVTLVAPGVTTITAVTEEGAKYLTGTATYKLIYLSGDGTQEHPYSAVDLNNVTTREAGEYVWVKGTILGSGSKSGNGIAETYSASNVVLGDDTSAPSLENTIPVFVQDPLRAVLDLTTDDSNVGSEIMVYGKYNNNYYKRCGISGDSQELISGLYSLSVSESGYATYYSPSAFVVPAGMQVGIVSAISGNKLTIDYQTYAEGSVVPKETGVIVKAPAGRYPVVFSASPATAPSNNLLRGSLEDEMTTGGDKYYMLSYDRSGATVGFYWGYTDGQAFVNTSFKAYLALTNTEVKGFSLDMNDGINSLDMEDQKSVVYDLAGRRVSIANKGIFIVNGKKIVK